MSNEFFLGGQGFHCGEGNHEHCGDQNCRCHCHRPVSDTGESEGFLCDRCGDLVDRPRSNEVDVCAACRKEIDGGMAAKGIKPTTEAQGAVPELIWINGENDYKHGVWTREQCGKGDISYTRSSTGLAEALRGLVVAYDIGRDIYWHSMNFPRPKADDTKPIAAAREALAKWEGKQQP